MKTKNPTFNFIADRVWGAAVVAFNINKGYNKSTIEGQTPNREIVINLLNGNLEISDSDIEEGRKIRQYFKGLMFKKIEGKSLNPFLQVALEMSGKEEITDNYSIATITSLPATYHKMVSRDDVNRRINWARGGFIGQVGNKTKQTIEVVKQIWSQQWNTYYITGINSDDQVLFFAYRNNIEIGDCVTIQGKIKGHRDNSTQLSHVKVIV